MRPHLLHNMSMPPRTSIRWEIRPIESSIVRFNLVCIESSGSLLWPGLSRFIVQKLERAWKGYGLKGAALIYPFRNPTESESQGAVPGPALYRATDARLVLNVLARTRGQVLMAGATLRLEKPFLERDLATDDPRIVALALSSGVKEE